jgi:hypothetical protein
MARRFRAAGVHDVAIERGDGPVVKVPLDAGFSVFVVPSRQIKSLRSRYGSAGKKDDRLDAYVLADTLRTDGRRWRPLREDHDDTRALRALCRARKDLVETRVQLTISCVPISSWRCRVRSDCSPGWTARSPCRSRDGSTAEKAAWLSVKRFASWLTSVGYSGGVSPVTLFERLTAAAPGLAGAEGLARGRITLALVASIESLNAQVEEIEEQISVPLDAHPDKGISTSLPRSGMVRAASLLAEIGDCRERSPPMTHSPSSPVRPRRPRSPANAGTYRIPLVVQQ